MRERHAQTQRKAFHVVFFLQLLLLDSSNWPMMKKNQSADGITKPNDGNGSERYNRQFVRCEIGSSRKIGCLFIDSAAPNNDAESITDRGRICSHSVRAVHYSQNRCPYFGHYLHEKIQKVSDSAGRCGCGKQTGHKWCLRKMQLLLWYNTRQLKYIPLKLTAVSRMWTAVQTGKKQQDEMLREKHRLQLMGVVIL